MVTRGKDSHPYENELIPTQVEARITSHATFDGPTPSALSEEERFKLMSWSLEDYEHAMANDEFFEYVKTMFTDTEEAASIEDRMQFLKNKFFVAGGSARYTFDGPVEQAMDDLIDAIEMTDDIEGYVLNKRGVSPSGVVNRLYAWRRVGDSDATATFLLSRFVGRQLAQKLGPEFVQNIPCSLAAFDRRTCMFELWFFAKLVHGGIEYHMRAEDGVSVHVVQGKWWTSKVQYFFFFFDPNGSIPTDTSAQWLAPTQWNQGGYDAVNVAISTVETKMVVRVQFVQVTRAETHTFKAEYFSRFLIRLTLALRDAWFEFVGVYFSVPRRILPKFKLQTNVKHFQANVLEPASLSTTETFVGVEGVGLSYEEFQENKHLDTKRPRIR